MESAARAVENKHRCPTFGPLHLTLFCNSFCFARRHLQLDRDRFLHEDRQTRMHFLKKSLAATALLMGLTIVLGCSGARGAGGADDAGPPFRGGILKIVGGSDVDSLSTTSAYTIASMGLLRTVTRQLVSYASSSDWQTAIQVAPDLTETLPCKENGGITDNGMRYTFHLRRDVTAAEACSCHYLASRRRVPLP